MVWWIRLSLIDDVKYATLLKEALHIVLLMIFHYQTTAKNKQRRNLPLGGSLYGKK